MGKGAQGQAVQDQPMEPVLKAPGTQGLKLRYDELHANGVFDFKLRRYDKVAVGYMTDAEAGELLRPSTSPR
jgi:hypothetical protein